MMETNDLVYSALLRDFQDARRRAALEDLKARLTGKSDDLLSYAAIRDLLRAEGSTRRGLQDIPLDAIVGSVGRHHDFTRSFLPRRESDMHRWANVKLKALYQGGFPPIEVYKLGDAYFVLDGNHRVSVARQLGAKTIQAYVTEVHSRVALSADAQPEDLIISARYADFLELTALDKTRSGVDLSVTAPGQYRKLEQQVEAQRQLLARDQGDEVTLEAAAASWYDHIYLPVVQQIRDLELVDNFPERTETDLFIWVWERQEDLAEEIGWTVDARRVLVDELAAGRLRQRPGASEDDGVAAVDRGSLVTGSAVALQPLFPDILVPISGTEHGWLALEQALLVAQREGSALHGFHVIRSSSSRDAERAASVQAEFDHRCQEAGVAGQLVLEVGPVARTICQRAHWTDLVIANLAFPPARGLAGKLQSGFRTLVHRCSRPVLAVPQVSPLSSALLAFDGSPRAREALAVATYLAGRWRIPLAVVTVLEATRTSPDTLDVARNYIAAHGVEAQYLELHGSVAGGILQAAAEQQADLLIMGGYGYSPMWEAMLGSAVDRLLRECQQPMLVCK